MSTGCFYFRNFGARETISVRYSRHKHGIGSWRKKKKKLSFPTVFGAKFDVNGEEFSFLFLHSENEYSTVRRINYRMDLTVYRKKNLRTPPSLALPSRRN